MFKLSIYYHALISEFLKTLIEDYFLNRLGYVRFFCTTLGWFCVLWNINFCFWIDIRNPICTCNYYSLYIFFENFKSKFKRVVVVVVDWCQNNVGGPRPNKRKLLAPVVHIHAAVCDPCVVSIPRIPKP